MSPLEIPLVVRKEIEIAWCQVIAVGRMGEDFKLQRLQSINRCASSVRSCIFMQQRNPRFDPLTRHTLRRSFFIVSVYRAELTVFPASKKSLM